MTKKSTKGTLTKSKWIRKMWEKKCKAIDCDEGFFFLDGCTMWNYYKAIWDSEKILNLQILLVN